jgi:hypothetical protein
MTPSKIDRRTFLERTAIAGGALTMAGVTSPFAAPAAADLRGFSVPKVKNRNRGMLVG